MKKFILLSVVAGLIILIGPILVQVWSTVKVAQDFSVLGLHDACVDEISNFCPSQSNSGKILQCLQHNKEILSPPCQTALTEESGRVLENTETVHGISLPKGSKLSYSNGKLRSAVTRKPFVYKGIKFAPGPIHFHENGTPMSAKLAGDQVIDGVKYKDGWMAIFFDKNGKVNNAILAEDTRIDGQTYKGGTQIRFHNGKVTRGDTLEMVKAKEEEQHNVQNLKKAFKTAPQTIAGITFPKDTVPSLRNRGIYYLKIRHPFSHKGIEYGPGGIVLDSQKGYISSGTLDNDQEIDGVVFKGGTEIEFHNQSMDKGVLAKDQVIDGVKYKGGKEIRWTSRYEKKWVSYGTLAEDTEVNGVILKGGSFLGFSLNVPNTPERGILAYDQKINGLPLKAETRRGVEFDEQGRIAAAVLAEDATVDSVRYKGGTPLSFHNGKPSVGILAENTTIKDITFKEGTTLSKGRDLWGTLAENTKIGPYLYKANTDIQIRANAKIPYSGTLAESAIIDGQTYQAGTKIRFNEQGEIKN